MNKFQELGLNSSILKAIEDMGFESPSEVQEKTILPRKNNYYDK